MIKAIILLNLLIYFLIQAVPANCAGYIRKVNLVRLNVFDRQLEDKDNFIYRLANKFHVVTKEQIIRQELLFSPGDSLNEDILEQSTRNIRALPFIGEAESIIKFTDGDSVDIEIITEDLWTTAVGISGEGGGGRYNFTIYADEKNVAGRGLEIDANVQFTTDDDNGYLVRFSDRRLFKTRLMADLWFRNLTYNKGFSLTLFRPFYSLESRWSYGGNINFSKTEPRLFYQGDEIYRYKLNVSNYDIAIKRAFGIHNRLESGFLVCYDKHDYNTLPGDSSSSIIPEDETFSGPGFDLKISTRRYFTAVYLDEFGNTEDLTEHVSLKIGALRSDPAFDASFKATYVNIETGIFFKPVSNVYAGIRNNYSSLYTGSGWERMSNIFESIIYIKPSTYHLIAWRFLSNFAWRQKNNYQVVLGGISGLRGYPDRYFEGTRLGLTNAEYKIFTPLEVLTVRLGGALFYDAGYVWDKLQSVNVTDFRSNIGVGLRFGLVKSSTARIVCVDIAKALENNNWYLSFRTGNLFGLARFQ